MLVVLPYHTELYDTFGDGSDLEGGLVFGVFLEEGGIFEGRGELCQSEASAGKDCLREELISEAYLCTPAQILALTEG